MLKFRRSVGQLAGTPLVEESETRKPQRFPLEFDRVNRGNLHFNRSHAPSLRSETLHPLARKLPGFRYERAN
jgi:hypothetical protein